MNLNAYASWTARLVWSVLQWAAVLGFIIAVAPAFGATLGVTMRHTFGGEPLQLDSLRFKNATGETLSVTRLSYLLSGFALEKSDGTWVELPEQVAWMDAAQGR